MNRLTAATLLRTVRVAVDLAMLHLLGQESFGLGLLLLVVDLALAVWVRRLRRHAATPAPNVDVVPTLYIAGLFSLAVLAIADHPGALQIPLGQPGTPNAAYVAVLLAAALPATFIDSGIRALYRWIKVSLTGDGRKPWTTTASAATAAAGSVAILALRTPQVFQQELPPAICLLSMGLLMFHGLAGAVRAAGATIRPTSGRNPGCHISTATGAGRTRATT